MMGMVKLYKYAETNNIDIDYFPMSATKALSIPGAIALNPKALKSNSEIRECLAHELGHQATGSFYRLNSKFETRTRMEEKAIRWAVHELIPMNSLLEAFESGYTEIWQLSEYFDVSTEFIQDAIRIYEVEKNTY